MPIKQYTANMRLYRLLLILFIHIASGSMLFADTPSSDTKQNETILNAIHSDEVRNIMRRLNILFYEREYTELELQKLSTIQIELLAEEANVLAQTAADLPNIDSLKKAQ